MTAPKKYKFEDDSYYVIEPNETHERYRWVWTEQDNQGAWFSEAGSWTDSYSKALRSAADDWDGAGSGGRLSATLRGAASRIEKNRYAS